MAELEEVNGISKCQHRSFKVPIWHFGLHFGGNGRVASHQAKAQCNPKGIGRKGHYCEKEWQAEWVLGGFVNYHNPPYTLIRLHPKTEEILAMVLRVKL